MLKHHAADTGWPTSNQGTTEQERQFYPSVIMGHGHPYGKHDMIPTLHNIQKSIPNRLQI